MNKDLASQYYRLALAAAMRRDLSAAIKYARYARVYDDAHENAAKLLCLCAYETGCIDALDNTLINPEVTALIESTNAETNKSLAKIRSDIKRNKWRKAASRAKAIPHRSARVLKIRGCIFAASGRYGKAGRCFVKALKKDRGDADTAAYLADIQRR